MKAKTTSKVEKGMKWAYCLEYFTFGTNILHEENRLALTLSMLHNRNAAKQSSTITHRFGNCSHQGFVCSSCFPITTSLGPSDDKTESTPVPPPISESSDL